MHKKQCSATNHRSREMPDPVSHQRNAEEKESASTLMAHPKERENLLTRHNPSKKLPLNICIPGHESTASLCESDRSGRDTPTREAITTPTHSTAPITSPCQKKEPLSLNQPTSNLLSTNPCNKTDSESQDVTLSCPSNSAVCGKSKLHPGENPESDLP